MTKLREWADEKYGHQKVEEKINGIIDGIKTMNIKSMAYKINTMEGINRLEKLIGENNNIEYNQWLIFGRVRNETSDHCPRVHD